MFICHATAFCAVIGNHFSRLPQSSERFISRSAHFMSPEICLPIVFDVEEYLSVVAMVSLQITSCVNVALNVYEFVIVTPVKW